jgi:hypothetical protein
LFQKTILRIAKISPMCTLLVAGPSFGQMIPLEDERWDHVQAILTVDEDEVRHDRPVPFAYWEDATNGLAEHIGPCPEPPPDQCLIGQCWGTAFQYSQFFPAGIQFSGGTGAGWDDPAGGLYSVTSKVGFKFQIDETLDYDLFVDVDPGDGPALNGTYNGSVSLWAYHAQGFATLVDHSEGVLQTSGRLGPGTYKLQGYSTEAGSHMDFQGPVYAAQWTVHVVSNPIVPGGYPRDDSTGCGGTIVLTVPTAGPQSSYTFQWRRNFVPLVDGPSVLGATTATLTLTNVCSEDDYDVLVTGPDPDNSVTITEPSRLAHVAIITNPTGVENEPTTPTATVVRAPAPNPFRISTSVVYEVNKPARLVAAVYNVSGAQVRSIVDRTVSGPGAVTWDGRLRSGERAPAGLYFLRVGLDEVRETRKVVLIE